MLAGIVATVVIFFAVRFSAERAVKNPAICNAAGAGAVLFFLTGIWAGAALFGASPPPTIAVGPPAAVVLPTAAPSPSPAAIAPVSHLTAASGPATHAVIDGITTDAHLTYGPPGVPLPLGPVVFVRGWAVSGANTPLKRIIFIIDHRLKYDGTAKYGNLRPDIAKAFNNNGVMASGFSDVALPAAGLARGVHVLQIGGAGADDGHYQLSSVNLKFTLQ